MSGIVSNPEILASGLQCTVRSEKTVIAIVPQIGTAVTPAVPSSSPSASNAPTQPFSAVLEQAQPSANESLGTGTTQTAAQGSHSPVSGVSKREPKTPDTKLSESKTNDSQGRGSASTSTPASTPDASDKTVPMIVVQPLPSPDLSWNAEIKDFISNAAGADVSGALLNPATLNNVVSNGSGTASSTSGADLATKADTAGQATSLPTLTKDPVLAKTQGDASSQDSPNLTAKSASTDAINAEAASLVTSVSSRPASDSRTQQGSTSVLARNIARGTTTANDDVNKAQAAVKSEIEQAFVPSSVVAPQISPATGKLETGSQGTPATPGLDKSSVSVAQDNLGTTRSADVAGSAKAQPRKDDTSSSTTSQGNDAGAVIIPAKAIDPSTAFSVAGIQPSTTASDGKSVPVSVAHESGDQQAGQLGTKSTGVAQTQAQGESVAPYPTSLVHSAKLVERIGEAELRLGIRAGEFGSVDIRTSMIRNQFTAEISTERGELGRALTAELPSLQNRLNEQRVPVANITVQSNAGGNSAASEQQKPRDGQPVYATNIGSAREQGLMPALVALEGTAPASRLDIHM
jgi:flagellar hook-length control protein FliK